MNPRLQACGIWHTLPSEKRVHLLGSTETCACLHMCTNAPNALKKHH